YNGGINVVMPKGTQFNPFAPSTATVTYTVANTGNLRLDAHPAVTVHGPFGMLGRRVATQDLGELLPGNTRHFQVEVPAVWAFFGLVATVRLEPFPSNPADSAAALDLQPLTASGTAFALNWGQLILLGVAGVLALAWWRSRRRRAAAVQAAIDEAVRNALADTGEDPVPPAGSPPGATPGRGASP
ncbi:MAG: hypothetical protein AAGC63_08235, partial [Propionicimonas sp.]